jgi:hypothetical protein
MASRLDFSQIRSLYVGTSSSTQVDTNNLIVAGNVGIGTTAPAFTSGDGLEIQRSSATATLRLDSGVFATELRAYTDGTFLGQLSNSYLDLGTDNSTKVRITAAGNVGIGTTSPANKLEVDGGSSAVALRVSTTNTGVGVASLILSNSSKSAFNDGVKITHGAGYTNVTDLAGTSVMVWDMSNTRVGIGTTAPGAKLDVNGEVYVSPNTAGKNTFVLTTNASNDGRLLIKSDTTTNVDIQANGTTYFNGGNVGIGTTSPAAKLQVENAGDVLNLKLTTGGYNALTLSTVNFSGGNNYAINPYITGVSNGGFEIKDLTNNASRIAIAPTSGNVGIGTTEPAKKLVVQSSSQTWASAPQIAFYDTETAQTDSRNWTIGAISTNWGSLNIASSTAAGGDPTTPRFTITKDGNVGIGTTSPDEKLRVSGKIKADAVYVYDGLASGQTGIGASSSGGDLRLYSNGSIGAVLSTAGNVGIGTTSPSGKLHIAAPTGTASPGSIALAIRDAGSPTFGFDFNLEGVTTGDLSLMRTVSGVQSQVMTFDRANGNVGIGTTAPGYKLEVNGYIRANDRFYATNGTNTMEIGSTYIQSYLNSGTAAAPIIFYIGISEKVRIDAGGNVGIGTTAPVTKLQVASASNAVDVLRIGNTAGDLGSVQGVTHLAINHFNAGTNPSTRITAYQDSTSGWPGGMYFSTRSLNTDSAPLERMRITSAGNVGIGTTSPQYLLDVNGDAQINAQGTGPAYAYVPDGEFGLDSLLTSGSENVALGKPDVWLRIHVDGVAFVFPGYQES